MIHNLIRKRLHDQAGIYDPVEILKLDDLEKSEWSPTFEHLMRNRLIMGALRYGKLNAKGKPKYDRIAACIKRLNKFKTELNKELLVDVANLCLLEFEENHNAHFKADDDGEHVERRN